MFILMILLFIVGYLCIALEHPLKINKAASALLLGVLLWVVFVVGGEKLLVNTDELRDFSMLNPGSGFYDWLVHSKLIELLGDIAQILFFLIGAMTIVETVDSHGGFRLITDKIKTTGKVKLLWIVSIITFFMSAALDNLTTSIIMVALLRKLIDERKDRWFFASMVIIAANAGGAWSPIGDVTTIMLWVANKVTAMNIIEMTFLSSTMSLIVPLIVLTFILKGEVKRPQEIAADDSQHFRAEVSVFERNLFFFAGVGALLFVPVFKSLTHLPPYLGMVGGLAVLWILSEIIHRQKDEQTRKLLSIPYILTKIDMPSILFFLGILVAVGALQTCGHLALLSANLEHINLQEPSKYYVITMIIGVLSSIVDNVPLVAGAMGMYNFATDHYFWEFLAYCAGTGGSILIIGSAAGVAVMGLEKIDFIWYLKKISWIALIGYFAGCGVFIAEKAIRQKIGSEHHANTVNIADKKSVEDYLLNNTYYVVEQSPSEDGTVAKDSIVFNFLKFKDKTGNEYLGIGQKIFRKAGHTDSYIWINTLENCTCTIENAEESAIINFCSSNLELDKQGRLYYVDGDIELKRK